MNPRLKEKDACLIGCWPRVHSSLVFEWILPTKVGEQKPLGLLAKG